MKVSIITVVLNNKDHIEGAIKSVQEQTHKEIEHIVVDNDSCDGTSNIIKRHMHGISRYICEPDQGVYFGINKGLKIATGDIVGILHSDDIYADENILKDIVSAFEKSGADCVYGDLVYVKRQNPNVVVRYWRADEGDRAKISQGWMPPHPAFFVKRNVYEKYGYFNTNFKISADYEIILRFLYMHRLSMYYAHRMCVKMRAGGISNRSVLSLLRKTYEDYSICKIYGMKQAKRAVILKNLRKIPQFIVKYKNTT